VCTARSFLLNYSTDIHLLHQTFKHDSLEALLLSVPQRFMVHVLEHPHNRTRPPDSRYAICGMPDECKNTLGCLYGGLIG
jgi:hypothetical protein